MVDCDPLPDPRYGGSQTTFNVTDPAFTGGLRPGSVVDWRPAIDAASLAAARVKGTVFFPAGTYRVTLRNPTDGYNRALTIHPGITWQGAGRELSVIKLADGAGDYMALATGPNTTARGSADDLSGFACYDLCFDGNTTHNPVTSVGQFTRATPNDRARVTLFFPIGRGIRVERCRFRDIDAINTLVANAGEPVGATGGTADIHVLHNVFEQVGGRVAHDASVVYVHGRRIWIQGNRFSGRTRAAVAATTAIETHGSQQVVTGNVIEDFLNGANITGSAHESVDVEVSHNVVRRGLIGITLWSHHYPGGLPGPALRNVSVADNSIELDIAAWRARSEYAATVSVGIALEAKSDSAVDRCTVQGNTVRWTSRAPGVHDDQISAGIGWWRSVPGVSDTGLSFIGNTVEGAPGCGIRLSANTRGCRIAGNTIRTVGGAGAAIPDPFRSGILLAGEHADTTVQDNEIVDGGPHPAMRYGILQANTAAEGLRIVDNRVRAPAALAEVESGARPGSAAFIRQRLERFRRPTYPALYGSVLVDESTGRTYRQTASPAGTRWEPAAP